MTDRSGAHAIASTRGWRRPPTPSPSGADQFTRRLAIGRGAENERVAACPEWLGDTLIPPLLPMCSTCLFRASREESAILLGAELREVGASRRWIRFEVEPMSGIWWRRGRDRNRRRTLEKVAAELVRRVAESSNAPGYAAPIDFH